MHKNILIVTATKWLADMALDKLVAGNAHALLTIPHGLFLPIADRRPLAGYLGEL